MALAAIESFDGGVEEFVEFIPNRRVNSAFSAANLAFSDSNVPTQATNPATSTASS